MITRTVLAGLLAAVFGTACREAGSCAVPCGTAVVVVQADADALLPPVTTNPTGTMVSDLLFLKLADLGPALNTVGDSGFVPRLARNWTFPDSLTIVFDLDPRARWSDGVPVTAADVAFTFDVYRDTLVNSPARALLDRIAGVTAVNDSTVRFRFRQAYPEQFYDATHHMRVIPRHLLDSIPRARLGQHPFTRQPVGDGPYRLGRWMADATIELDADSAFALGRPGLARIVWTIVPDMSAGIDRLLAGAADVMEVVGVPELMGRIESDTMLHLYPYPSSVYGFLDFNLRDADHHARPHPLFGDRELRRAIVEAIDRQTLVTRLMGRYGHVPAGPAPLMTAPGRDTTSPQLPFDSAAARRALAGLGWTRGADGVLRRGGTRLSFEVLVPGSSQLRHRAALMVQDQLRAQGIEMRIATLDFNTFSRRLADHRFDAALMAWSDDPTPSGVRQTFTTAAMDGVNYGSYSDTAFDRLVNEASATASPAAALARWRAAYAVINNDAPAAWLFAPTQVVVTHRRLRNVAIRPDQWAATMWTWEVAPGQSLPRDVIGSATR